MQLDKVSIAVTERRPWEAVDLGFAMTRAWAGPLYRAWLAVYLPTALLLLAACYRVPWLATLILWWLKPLLDRAPLYFLSRAAFGETVSVAQLWRALPRLWRRDFFHAITAERWSAVRSLSLPVTLLEGLRGATRRARVRVIAGTARNTAVGLTVGCVHIEQALILSGLGLVYLLLPSSHDIDWADIFRAGSDAPLQWAGALCYVAVIGMLEPFYVAGGFGLYLNRRIVLEGWDIELVFRRMAITAPGARPGWVAMALLLVLLAPVGYPRVAQAAAEGQVTADAIHGVTQQVLAEPAFRTTQEIDTWRWKSDGKANDDFGIGAWLGEGLRVAAWLAAALVVYLLLRALWRSRFFAAGADAVSRRALPIAPEITALAAPPEPLPEDVAAAARAALARGAAALALSLLYRGALRGLTRHAVSLPEGATEAEWLRAAERAGAPGIEYLRGLVRVWSGVVYGHRVPVPTVVAALCDEFDTHYGAAP